MKTEHGRERTFARSLWHAASQRCQWRASRAALRWRLRLLDHDLGHVVLGGEGFAEGDSVAIGPRWHAVGALPPAELQRALASRRRVCRCRPRFSGYAHSSSKEAVAQRALRSRLARRRARRAGRLASLELPKFTGLITDETGMRRPPLHCSMLPRVAETATAASLPHQESGGDAAAAVTPPRGTTWASLYATTPASVRGGGGGDDGHHRVRHERLRYSLDNYVACDGNANTRRWRCDSCRGVRGAADDALETRSDEVLGLRAG